MILPIITSITREIFLQTPRLHEEAALALGATRWEMIRLAVFPYARSGMVIGHAARPRPRPRRDDGIALIISPSSSSRSRSSPTATNSQTIAANIALNFPIATTLQRYALIGTGLLLFVVSLAVNIAGPLHRQPRPAPAEASAPQGWRRAACPPDHVADADCPHLDRSAD